MESDRICCGWSNDYRDGYGEFYFNNGSCFKGNWIKDSCEGKNENIQREGCINEFRNVMECSEGMFLLPKIKKN